MLLIGSADAEPILKKMHTRPMTMLMMNRPAWSGRMDPGRGRHARQRQADLHVAHTPHCPSAQHDTFLVGASSSHAAHAPMMIWQANESFPHSDAHSTATNNTHCQSTMEQARQAEVCMGEVLKVVHSHPTSCVSRETRSKPRCYI